MLAEMLGGEHGCNVAINALKAFPQDYNITLHGWQAVVELATHDEENHEILVRLGVKEMIKEAHDRALFSTQMCCVMNAAKGIFK